MKRNIRACVVLFTPSFAVQGCLLWQPTNHIMVGGGSLILFNYTVEWACGEDSHACTPLPLPLQHACGGSRFYHTGPHAVTHRSFLLLVHWRAALQVRKPGVR
jgi:hypothetical protein